MTQIIQDQSDDSTYDQILRELAFAKMIDRGLKDSEMKKFLYHLPIKIMVTNSWSWYHQKSMVQNRVTFV